MAYPLPERRQRGPARSFFAVAPKPKTDAARAGRRSPRSAPTPARCCRGRILFGLGRHVLGKHEGRDLWRGGAIEGELVDSLIEAAFRSDGEFWTSALRPLVRLYGDVIFDTSNPAGSLPSSAGLRKSKTLKKIAAKKSLEPRRRSILLVDDHPLFRKGMGQLLDGQPDLQVQAEAENSAGALRASGNSASTSRSSISVCVAAPMGSSS